MQTHFSPAAEMLATNCFFNALLREWDGWKLSPEGAVLIRLRESEGQLVLSFKHQGIAGRHQFNLDIWQQLPDSSPVRTPFLKAVELMCNTLAEEKKIPEKDITDFLGRVDNSLRNTQMALSERRDVLESLFHQPTFFAESEQALLAGHSIHPVPKSRTGMVDSDTRQFAPEFGQSFALHWFVIENSYLCADSVHEKSFAELTQQLVDEDSWPSIIFQNQIPEGFTFLPAHPWQAQQWMKNTWIASLLENGKLKDLGVSGTHWRATSSMRAIHAPHASFILKFSLSVKLTNSVRHLLPKEVERGKEIYRALGETGTGQEFRQRFPQFSIINEPAHGAIRDQDGNPMPETMTVLRENPFSEQNSPHIELLATLTQDNPHGECRLVNRIRSLALSEGRTFPVVTCEWFKAFLENTIEPLLVGQADYGLLFGAHQQNLLMDLTTGYPTRAWFRDCQGTGFSPVAQKLLADVLPKHGEHNEHRVEEDIGNKLFTYYLLINTTFGVTGALASSGDIKESLLLEDVKQLLHRLIKSNPRDTSCLDYMLNSEELLSKGNFFCCLQSLNENTLDNPLGIYHPMANPLLKSNSNLKNYLAPGKGKNNES
ncbi:IucA/IucC family protein [Parendozoicomonas sp. Alg238-R29]|uniref:IucA/IucC family protein n=1 Tax=Parendozoicomonas sp. Alg238-R29 TaxID=2993446 RepID=UPI00248E1146|nr:IucA/IucC family protein [Parendozoicomonas sp. Alg238-R29]